MKSLYESIVRHKSNKICLQLEDQRDRFTYKDIDIIASKICLVLDKIVNRNTITPLVCILLNRDVGFITSIIGCLKASCGYIPIDISYPLERQSYILSNSQCQYIITNEDYYKNYIVKLDLNISCIIIDSKTGQIKNKQVEEMNEEITIVNNYINENSLAYVIYTSGSTGKPKGIKVKHKSLENLIKFFIDLLHVDDNRIILSLTTFSFDISVLEIFLAISTGSTLVLANEKTQKDPYRIIELINKYNIDIFQATPTTYEMMIATGWNGTTKMDCLIGGEQCSKSISSKIINNCRNFYNCYGPTETTIWSSVFDMKKNNIEINFPIPIGNPINETQFFIVIPNSMILANEEDEGELLISGIGISDGYLNDDTLTNEKFIDNPFGVGKVYKTGDIVKLSSNIKNCYQFIRRIDSQVKLNGYRIELGEIESVFNCHHLVHSSVATIQNGKLVLFLKACNNSKLSQNDLIDIDEFVKKCLPSYMIPLVVQITEFSTTPNGKLDRRSLPTVAFTNDCISHIDKNVHHGESISNILVEFIGKINGVQLTPSSTFSSFGIDSLAAVLLLRQMSKMFDNIKITPEYIYSPGTTIKSFSILLYKQLQNEKPDFLRISNLKEDNNDDESNNNIDSLKKVTNSCENTFEMLITSNIRFLQGLRGLFAFIVLWDHYYPINVLSQSPVIQQDTNLFVLLSGFTVGLKLRNLPVCYYSINNELNLEPPVLFPWKSFLITRCYGLFPVLWIALLFSIPSWMTIIDNASKASKGKSDSDAGVCTFLYIIGMQSWYRPNCKLGPNYVIYASVILNCFIIYTIFRIIFNYFQIYIMTWREKGLIASSNLFNDLANDDADVTSFKKERRWSQFIGNIVTLLFFNKANIRVAIIYILFAFLFNTLTMMIVWKNPIAKNAFIYIPYFIVGVCGASLLSILHGIIYKYKKAHEDDYDNTRYNMIDEKYNSLYNYLHYFSPRISTSSSSLSSTSTSSSTTTKRTFSFYLWRHLPDLLAILSGLLLTPVGHLDTFKEINLIGFVFLHWVVIIFIIVSMLQVGIERFNIIRYILELPILNIMGYCSYSLYLFQRLIIEYYVTNLYRMSSFRDPNDFSGRDWFSTKLSYGWRLFIILILIFFCYLIQYFTDEFIVIVISRRSRWRNEKVYITNKNENTLLKEEFNC